MAQITPENILRHELIGLDVKIANCCNKQIIGMKGKVVFETKKTLFIEDGKDKKIIPKNIAKFQFKLPSGTIVNVDGIKLIGKPENRLKTKVRKW